MPLISEEQVELQSIEWFKELGYQFKDGYEIAPEGVSSERDDFRQVILEDRLKSALIKINPDIPNQTIQNSIPLILNPNIPGLLNCNREMHKWITRGLKVTFIENNQEVGRQLKLIDFDDIENNDWLVVNQFEVQGDQRLRRPDVLVFVNGLPLGVIELKNPSDEHADIWSAYNQLQTYKENIPDLFNTNGVLVISDGIQARMGSLTATQERFMRWRTIDGETLDPLGEYQDLETLIRGLFNKETFLNYIRYFCVFEDDKTIIKKIAGYHQFYAVQKALEKVVEASQIDGDKKGGVVWHTQGAGKSLEMTCLAGKIVSDIRLSNPTIVMVTDRQDLDGQLFEVFNDA
jgi:type I restriction enzyme R subunit